MKKNKTGGKLILTVGIIGIIISTVCAFKKDDIVYYYYKFKISDNNFNTTENDYYIEDNFNYVDNYTDAGIKSKKELLDFIYYTINSGNTNLERYIDKDYTNYQSDLRLLTNNDNENFKNIISNLNNFVHPYNSTKNVILKYGNDYEFSLDVERTYTEEEINEINKVVDKVMNEYINNSMPVKEKIKVIHDYIIDNTEYDKLKSENKKDTTYKSSTAYGVLIEGYGTCNGYADAMAIFLDKLNVINYKISNDEHIWNLVYLDGKWYHLDLTWDDPISDINVNRNTYFLITTKELKEINDGTHNFDEKIYSEAK